MKKIYLLAGVFLATAALQAQTTVDFEDLQLEENSYYDGSDNAGKFASGSVMFSNDYNADWSVWSGFAYSNMKDDTTSGFMNQYSAYPAIGADESSNYSINFLNGTISFPSTSDLTSVKLTNTTYAYLSMRDGDDYTKKFGENGDKDYFYINIYGLDANDETIDTVQFYLADFTSDNSEDHYILDTWKLVDLSSLTGVKSLSFEYFSTDIGDWGINTPTYFALDNLVYEERTSNISTENLATFKMYPNPANNTLNINGEAGEYIIMNVNGQTVMSFQNNGFTTVELSSLKSGIYFVNNKSITGKTEKLIIQ